ncbi:hypothetical protein NP233_g5239 [Leucocoprinus birnbaumii]|uniref:Nephrocystin 3-like N-terminal domain-containing protein n=1 Tax=Leucocoprinus birnbaumii TaxID=56174 RepID=A0AAD5VZK0_9AGAR|nr:hypothetical protein NP233_g5239 [Leucocoprinus birnbaumii]
MSFFQGANNFVIEGSTFEIIHVEGGTSGIAALQEASQPDATHDSSARHPAPKCFPGTREQYVQDIIEWAEGSSNNTNIAIYRVRGAAGVGKTAVAQTCAELLQNTNRLGVSFFFSINRPGDHHRFVPSLAYQLSTQFPGYSSIVNRIMQRNKALVSKNITSQYDALITRPLRELEKSGSPLEPRIILVDGLDECLDKAAQCEIIEIAAASVRGVATPFRWIFFSRPESHIEATFSSANIAPLCHTDAIPVTRDSDKEIESYLRGGLENILRARNIRIPVHAPCPLDEDIRILVSACAGLFIYAATVLRFIEHYPSLGIDEPLRIILTASSTPLGSHLTHKPRSSVLSPFVDLDAFYTLIMQRIPQPTLRFLQLSLAAMFYGGFMDASSCSAAHLSNTLGFSEIEFRSICSRVLAVIDFCDLPWQIKTHKGTAVLSRSFEHASDREVKALRGGGRYPGCTISFYHRSFCDYLEDPSRSGIFCITQIPIQTELFRICLERHHIFSESLVIQGTSLVLAPNITASASSLTWPYPDAQNEFVNSYAKARAFNQVGALLFRLIRVGALDQKLMSEIAMTDHRKRMLNRAAIYSKGSYTSLTYGATGLMQVIKGTIFRYVPPAEFGKFDILFFKEVSLPNKRDALFRPPILISIFKALKRQVKLKQSRRYSPTFLSRCTAMVHEIIRETENSGVYVCGKGQASYFWYWEINTDQRFYFEFETCNLTEAESMYRENGTNIFR